MTDRTLSFGIKTSQMGTGYPEICRIWREADQIPVFEHAWLWDHMVPLRGDIRAAALEAWTLLAALAAQTSRLRLGVLVTSNRLRSPTLLAKMAATVDVIAGGRLILGIGAGGSAVPIEHNPAVREFAAYGVPLVTPGQAVRDLAQSLDIIKRMWTSDEPFDFTGPTITAHRRGVRAQAGAAPAPAGDDRRAGRAAAARGGRARRHLGLPGPAGRHVPAA